MTTQKMIPKIVGTLFIITMISGMIDAYLVAPILKNSLSDIYPNNIRVIAGALFILVMSIGIVGIAVFLFPVLKKHNEIIAITYVSFRTIECMLLLVGVIIYFFLIRLSNEFINAGTPDASYFQTLYTLAIDIRYLAYQNAMIILGFGSLFLCYLFYQSKLIPRFLSAWGFIGYALLLASALLDIFGVIDTINGTGAIMYVPGGLWEFIVFPIWLIIKGFDSSKTDDQHV